MTTSRGKTNRADALTRRIEEAARKADDLVDEWGRQSFPASDPPANW